MTYILVLEFLNVLGSWAKGTLEILKYNNFFKKMKASCLSFSAT